MRIGDIRTTQEEVKQIITLYRNGVSTAEIGRIFEKDRTTMIYWIRKYKKTGKIPTAIKGKRNNETKKNRITSPTISRFQQSSHYKDIFKAISKREGQKKCRHNAIVNNQCFLCGFKK